MNRTSVRDRPQEQYASFRTAIRTGMKAVDVPIGNTEAVDVMFGSDSEPIEFINAVMIGEDNPVYPFGDRVILTEKWANSFAKAVSDRPGWLYTDGHEDIFQYKTRAVASGYIIGAKVEGDALYLRNRLLPRLSDTGKDKLQQTMKEIKAGLLSTSTGDYQRYEWKEEIDEETGKKELVGYAVESVKGQSNALVEWDMTGSEAHIIASSFKESQAVGLKNTDTGDEHMELNGKDVSVEEFFSAFKEARESGELAVSDIASRLGLDVVSEEERQALNRVVEAEKEVGNISEYVKNTKELKEETFSQLRESTLRNTFPNEEVCEAAAELFTLKDGTVEDVKAEVERLTGLKVIQAMQKAIAGSINSSPSAEAGGTNEQDDTAKTGTLEA